MNKYFCEECKWQGNEPVLHDEYGDGGYPVCPDCTDFVYLNPLFPENAKKFIQALRCVRI